MPYSTAESSKNKTFGKKNLPVTVWFPASFGCFSVRSLPACLRRWMLKNFTNEAPDNICVWGEGKGRERRGVLLSSGALEAVSKAIVVRIERAASASLGDNLAAQGIKAARGNKVCGQDRVSVNLEATLRNAWEAKPLSEQRFKGTEEPLWYPHHPSKTKTMSILDSQQLWLTASLLFPWWSGALFRTRPLPQKGQEQLGFTFTLPSMLLANSPCPASVSGIL